VLRFQLEFHFARLSFMTKPWNNWLIWSNLAYESLAFMFHLIHISSQTVKHMKLILQINLWWSLIIVVLGRKSINIFLNETYVWLFIIQIIFQKNNSYFHTYLVVLTISKYGCQTYRFGLYCTDMRDFVQLTDQTFICTLKCTDFIVFIQNNWLFCIWLKQKKQFKMFNR
jgi:hypothetical protein